MLSLKPMAILGAAMLWFVPLVSSAPLEKRLAPGYSETGGSATVQYTDPDTNILWIKNYHFHQAGGSIQEAAYRSDTGSWAANSSPGAYGLQNGGLAAFTFMDDNNSTPVIHLFYDDLTTGNLKSLVWTTIGGWTTDSSYNTVVASAFTNTARTTSAFTFDNGVRHFEVFVTTSAGTINQITWNPENGWVANITPLVTATNGNAINRDATAVQWGSSSDISLFYATQVGITNFWNINELHYSSSTNQWTPSSHGSNFNNLEGQYGIGLAAVSWRTSNGVSVRLCAQGDSYVELATDAGAAWTSSVLGSCTSESIVRQGQLSAVHWLVGSNNNIHFYQVQCTDSTCSAPTLREKFYNSAQDSQWHNGIPLSG